MGYASFAKLTLLSSSIILSSQVNALNTVTISQSTLSADCIDYRIVGICYWLSCSMAGCSIKTSIKVRHYIPDAVVSSYTNTGKNPWKEVALMSMPIGIAKSGAENTINHVNENTLAKFKNADVIGHPGSLLYNQFMSQFSYTCGSAANAFVPYFLSILDSVAWRYNLPETIYPEAITPGLREIGARSGGNLWGNVYPRGGFTHQIDGYKAAATIAQRAGDIVTRRGQPHVYTPLLANQKEGYWPAGELIESDIKTGKWQELTPTLSNSCKTFPDLQLTHRQADDGGYAWTLWRPYSCCKRRGQVFLGSVDF